MFGWMMVVSGVYEGCVANLEWFQSIQRMWCALVFVGGSSQISPFCLIFSV